MEFVNPILTARLAAQRCINAWTHQAAELSDIKVCVKRLTGRGGRDGSAPDICYPLMYKAAETGFAPEPAGMEPPAMPADELYMEIPIFSSISLKSGYVNFKLGAEFLLAASRAVTMRYPMGKIRERIALPDSIEYAHARLIMYVNSERCRRCDSAAQRTAAVIALYALSILEEEAPNALKSGMNSEGRRIAAAAAGASLRAMDGGEGFDPVLAAAIAAALNKAL